MAEDPLRIFEKLDPELLKLVDNTKELALNDGTLPRKIKLLIAMALDASKEAVEGVKSRTEQALKAGANHWDPWLYRTEEADVGQRGIRCSPSIPYSCAPY